MQYLAAYFTSKPQISAFWICSAVFLSISFAPNSVANCSATPDKVFRDARLCRTVLQQTGEIIQCSSLRLVQSLRRWPNIRPALVVRLFVVVLSRRINIQTWCCPSGETTGFSQVFG